MNKLKIFRVVLSVIFFSLITFFFLDFSNTLSNRFHILAHLQFIPAVILSMSTWVGGAFISAYVVIMLVLLALTLLFGRIYCSSLCPMGVFQDIVAWFSKRFKRKKRYTFSPQKNVLRWTVVVVSAVTFIAGFPLILSLVEPYSAFGRMIANVVSPVYIWGNNVLASIFISFDNYTFIPKKLFIKEISSFIIALLTLVTIGFLAWKYGRTFCNTVCPTGTILGFVSRFSRYKIQIDHSKCNHCGLCAMKCKASCIDSKNQQIDDRCVSCFNCLSACNKNALTYSPTTPNPSKGGELAGASSSPPLEGLGEVVSRRKFFATSAVVAGATCSALVAKANPTKGNIPRCTVPITPPGSKSARNLRTHCTSCHLCVSKCPSNVLKPAFLEYGLGGMMQPMMTFERGFCNFNCTTCGEVCPNGAIMGLSKEQKHRTQVGIVRFVEEICVVHTDATNCGACAEHCPVQAVRMVPYKNGLTIPKIEPDICVGCGGCEYICPVYPRAIFVEGLAEHREAKPIQKSEKMVLDDEIGFGF